MTTIQIKVPNWLDGIFALPVLLYRLLRYGYTFRKIPLGEGRFAIVDPQDFYRFNVFNWCPAEDKWNTYAIRPITVRDRVTVVSLHREIMGHPKGLLVDHRNNNGLDNRRVNLRPATHSQNMQNRAKTRAKTSSRFIGVSFYKRRGCWYAYINYGGKRIWLGRFDSEIDAAKAYDVAAKKYHGDFARLNFSEEAPIVAKASG